ncbi:MAG: peptidoglycan-associated lipoprotein Pal [Candidatus Schekmanbacteria bacterium]|nr:peptidoglycan-associated lipoprotein Pal [Candidatus Schekmanbacteria bacterium]
MLYRKPDRLLIVLFISAFLPLLFMSSCTKKQVVKEEAAPVEQAVKEEAKEQPAETQVEEKEAAIDEESLKSDLKRQIESKLQDVFFDYDRYDLTDSSMKKLEANAAVMKSNPSASLIIEGHCDERGTVEYNLVLGDKRANTAKNYLVTLGIDSSRIDAISYGRERPFDSGHSEIAWAKNRRAHFVVK